MITDIKMPKMNGLDLGKTCRDTYGQIPLFIFLTSYEEFPLIKQAMSYQAVDYLIKLELTPASLTASVRRALERLEEYRASQAYRKKGGEDRPTLQELPRQIFHAPAAQACSTARAVHHQAKDLRLDFSDPFYLAAHGEISQRRHRPDERRPADQPLFQQPPDGPGILGKHLPCTSSPWT